MPVLSKKIKLFFKNIGSKLSWLIFLNFENLKTPILFSDPEYSNDPKLLRLSINLFLTFGRSNLIFGLNSFENFFSSVRTEVIFLSFWIFLVFHNLESSFKEQFDRMEDRMTFLTKEYMLHKNKENIKDLEWV